MKDIKENWPLLILAFFLSAVIWLLVITATDPLVKKSFEIPITLENEATVAEQGKTCEILGDMYADIVVEAKHSVLNKLSESDFKAAADFSDMYNNMQVPITVTCTTGKVSQSAIDLTNKSLAVRIENMISVTKAIEYALVGEPAGGYTLDEIRVHPESVTVTGPESFVKVIRKALVRIDLTGVTESFDGTGNLVLYDGNDAVLDVTETANASWTIDGVVGYHVEIQQVQSLPISVNVQNADKTAAGYRYIGYTVEPDQITLTGPKAVLSRMTGVQIEDVDLTGAKGTIEKVVDIRTYLPEGADVYQTSADVTLKLEIQPLIEREFEVPVGKIQVTDLPDGYEYRLKENTVTIVLRGLAADLDRITEFDGKLNISLNGLMAGSHEILVQTVLSDDALEQVGSVYVTAELKKTEADRLAP